MSGLLSPELHAELLKVVLERGYVRREEPFRLSSGGLSHDYVDMRRAVSEGKDLRLVADAVLAALGGVGEYAAIGGMTMGADPVAHAVALVSGKSWFSVRKAEKDHGAGRRIEGAALGEGVHVVVFEDTVSTGQSLLDALDVVLASGATVLACATVLDRGDVACARFAERSVPYLALLDYRDLGIEPIGDAAASSARSGS
jgi:orotate phosphoribosyltransferase